MPKVKIVSAAEELKEIFALRYSIYIQELGKTFIHHDDEQKILKDEYDDSAFHVCLYENETLVGTVRLRYPPVNDPEINRLAVPISLQEKYRISVSSRMMLKKEFRNSKAIVTLMNFVYDKNIRDGIDFGVIEVEKHLTRMYRSFGFHEIGARVNEYKQERVLMFVNARDWEHFKTIESPYRNVFETMVQDMNNEMKTNVKI